jgi:hypothetical protein
MKDVGGSVLVNFPGLGEPGNDFRRVVITLVREGTDKLARFTPDFGPRDKHGVMRRRGATRLRRPEN